MARELAEPKEITTQRAADIAESLEKGSIATLISGCRKGAIASMLAAKPELAAVFIHLGAELIATAEDEVVIEAAITNPSKAISLISSLA
jgi:2-keto-3-deoxy-L-rhamnonate aldolase RhmA